METIHQDRSNQNGGVDPVPLKMLLAKEKKKI